MSRAALRSRRVQVAVILLACLITAPIAWADDYFHLSHMLQGTPEAGCPYSEDPESYGGQPAGEPEAQHSCSCLICILAIGEANAAGPQAPMMSGEVDPFAAWSLKQDFSFEIYHPPLA